MSFIVGFAEALLAIRSALIDNVQTNDPENYSKLTGAMNYLFSPMNPSTIKATMLESSNKGQYRPVEIRYEPHWGEGDTVTDDANAVCDPVPQRRDGIDVVEPLLFVESKFTLDEDYLRENTEDWDSAEGRVMRGFQKAMRVGRENMNNQIVAAMVAGIGSNPAAGTAAGGFTTVPVLDSEGAIDLNTFDTVRNQMEDNFMVGEPSVIGLGNARKVFNRHAVGNLNTSAGMDIQEIANQFASVLWKDQFVKDNAPSADHAIVAYPGLQQFFNYNLNKGFFAQNVADLRIKGTMPDPVFPFEWDYIMQYDDGCVDGNGIQGAWTVRVFSYFDLWTAPSESFGNEYGSLGAEFNGLVGYEFTAA